MTPISPLAASHPISRAYLWFWWVFATIIGGVAGFAVFSWAQSVLIIPTIIPKEMIWIPVIITVGISGIIGVAQALVLRYLLGRSIWWAVSWLLAGALMAPISWIVDDMGVIR